MSQAALPLTFHEIVSEDDLLAALRGLLRGCQTLTPAEKRCLAGTGETVLAQAFITSACRAIRAGQDPLGEAYARIHSPELRRGAGVTFTPLPLVDRMVEMAAALVLNPVLVVDCGAGSGRFALAALRRFRSARVLACELNPLLALIVRANARAAGFESRLEICVGDFREIQLPKRDGPTLFVGNPPYVRHHDIAPRWKQWYRDGLARLGIAGSQLAGLHLHFFLRARELAQPGDAGCFITSAEWLDVNYGSSLRELLLDGLGGRGVHLFPAERQLFADALTTSVITTFQAGREVLGIGFTDAGHARRSLTHVVPAAELRRARAWSEYARPRRPLAKDACATLGEFFKIQRGQVTGLNRVWIAGEHAAALPAACLFPAVTAAQEIIALAGAPLADASALRCVVDLPENLAVLSRAERARVDDFLAWAEREGARDSYVAGHRTPWWRVGLKLPPPVIMTYMGRRPPVFARNAAGARLLNIAHGLYPVQPLGDATLDALVAWLNRNVSIAAGRTYAGGLVKFEPGEAMRIPVPPLDHFRHVA